MITIDTRPASANILLYAGDTFEFYVKTDTDYSLHTWTAQVRDTHDGPELASFTIGANVVEGPLFTRLLTLTDQDTRDIADAGTVRAARGFATVFKGVWDVQVELNGVTKTLVQGDVTVEQDVTR